jgi:hypothetical protein
MPFESRRSVVGGAAFSVNQCRCQNSATLAGHVSATNQADDCELLMGTSPMPFDRVLHRLAPIDAGTG